MSPADGAAGSPLAIYSSEKGQGRPGPATGASRGSATASAFGSAATCRGERRTTGRPEAEPLSLPLAANTAPIRCSSREPTRPRAPAFDTAAATPRTYAGSAGGSGPFKKKRWPRELHTLLRHADQPQSGTPPPPIWRRQNTCPPAKESVYAHSGTIRRAPVGVSDLCEFFSARRIQKKWQLFAKRVQYPYNSQHRFIHPKASEE